MNMHTSNPTSLCSQTDAEEDILFPTRPPHVTEPDPERPVCTHDERCKGCPYPAHGFICWSASGPCMRTLTDRHRKSNTTSSTQEKETAAV